MRIVSFIFAVFSCAFIWVAPLQAQENDKDWLTRQLQDLLSDAGRAVNITGFEGALNSEARMAQMTIADDDGVWLTLEGVTLVWTRSALLSGRVEVDQLTADKLTIARLPVSQQSAAPQPEATSFALPELPVSIDIDQLSVGTLALGASILGEPAQMSMNASAQLDGTGLKADLKALRTDGHQSRFDVKTTLTRSDNILKLLLDLDEAPGGVVSRMLDVPGAPSIKMTVKGDGPLSDYRADVALATDGEQRLSGDITLSQQGDDREVSADIGGDITAILLPQYRDFFGTEVTLKSTATLRGSGEVDVQDFTLNAARAQLQGAIQLGADKFPRLVNLSGRIAGPDGKAVLLPGGNGAAVKSMLLNVDYDADHGDAYEASFEIKHLTGEGFSFADLHLTSEGMVKARAGAPRSLDGTVEFAAKGVRLIDRAMSEALGSAAIGTATLIYRQDQPFRIADLDMGGDGYGLSGDIDIGTGAGLKTRLDLRLDSRDISRFSALAGRELAGAADLFVIGDVVPLSGAFDLRLNGQAQDIVTGIAQVDALLKGATQTGLRARRDETGTTLRDVKLSNGALQFDGAATLATAGGRVEGTARLRDISMVLPEYSGPLSVTGNAVQTGDDWHVDARASGPYNTQAMVKGVATGPDMALSFDLAVPQARHFVKQVNGPVSANGVLRPKGQDYAVEARLVGPHYTRAAVQGVVTGPDMAVDFDLTVPRLQPFVPGMPGGVSASGRAYQTAEGIAVNVAGNGPYGLRGKVDGIATGAAPVLRFSANLPNVNALVPKVSGPLEATGTLRQTARGWGLNTQMQGVSGTRASIAGLIGNDGDLYLNAQGSAPLGLSGPFIAPRNLQGQALFDLAIKGPPQLSSLSGTIRSSGATLTAPNLRFSLKDIDANVQLSGPRASVALTANASDGGTFQARGGVGLMGNMPADISIALRQIIVADPSLYRAVVSGDIVLNGPLTGGARALGNVNVERVDVTVPSTGLTSIGDIPKIDYIGAPERVTTTRRRAGLLEQANAPSTATDTGPGYALDLNINAPRRIFVRGRGLDAELGGGLRLTGTTNRMISAGSFKLIRGRLDILGKRFDLVEGAIQFQGDLLPYIRFVSATDTPNGEVRVIVDGPADEPTVSFESSPAAPQDEVLAQLLFGRHISEISAFQALQLANAVAVLAGRSNGGVISKLRNGFGLDDLDVTTTEDGQTALRVGKYLTDNVYTDVTAASDGTGEVSLNLDLTDNLKAKAKVNSKGNSGLGLFFEKDY